jgi:hypothetical protein
MIRKSLLVLLVVTLVSPPVVGCAQTSTPAPPLDPAERQTAIAEDEKYLEARFLGEVPIKDKRGAVIEKRRLFFAGAYYGVPVTISVEAYASKSAMVQCEAAAWAEAATVYEAYLNKQLEMDNTPSSQGNG